MESKEFEDIAVEEWALIPTHFKEKIDNVALLIEDEPDEATREENGLEEGATLLGLYRGIPLTERGEGYGVGETLPDTITLFRYPILDESLTIDETPSEAVRMVIRDTLWHEIGHYFGHGEKAIEKREDEGTNNYEV